VPFYYDLNRAFTSNVSGATESNHWRLLTVANQETARIMGLSGGARFGTAGGGQLRIKTWSTASTGGTSQTPAKRNPNSPAASTTAFNDASTITSGTTATYRMSVGLAQTGGMGGLVPVEPAAAIALLANGGANGNADMVSIFNAASVTFDGTLDLAEGS
jgi:hypothetical protein